MSDEFFKIDPTQTEAWSALQSHFEDMQDVQMYKMFKDNPNRVANFHIRWNEFLLDYSKNIVTDQTMGLLFDLADQVKLKESIDLMFKGALINETENRAVLHTALRDFSNRTIVVEGEDVKVSIETTRKQIKDFTGQVLEGRYTTADGRKFTDVINIGIGGSDLGPKMVVNALENFRTPLGIHYVSNIDDDYLFATLNKLDPKTTLILVVSKSFTTQETIENAKKIKLWVENGVQGGDATKHLVAVTADEEEAIKFGIQKELIFRMWDYVGGRFSLWSAVGLSISLAIGYRNFESLLAGAFEMDAHFSTKPFDENIPVLMALISVWYNNFFEYETEAIVPYSQMLEHLPAHLQQMIMESNGKNKSRSGKSIDYETGTLIWGEVGVSAQHAFFQLFHQGTKVIPVDFIGFVSPFIHAENSNHDILMSNLFAQAEALMNGKSGMGCDESEIKDGLSGFREFKGNKPSNILLIDALTPRNLGSLLAIYEHKTFVQGIIWNIYSFDQFGVEFGKILAKNIQSEIKRGNVGEHDSSTTFLLHYYLSSKKSNELDTKV